MLRMRSASVFRSHPAAKSRSRAELSESVSCQRGEGTTRSRTLGGGVIQYLASMVRALVSMHQDSMRSLLWHCCDFQADSDWRGMRGDRPVMGMRRPESIITMREFIVMDSENQS